MEANGTMFKKNQVKVEVFKRRTDRVQVRSNLYIRNLPSLPELDLEPKLMAFFEKFGKVKSLKVK